MRRFPLRIVLLTFLYAPALKAQPRADFPAEPPPAPRASGQATTGSAPTREPTAPIPPVTPVVAEQRWVGTPAPRPTRDVEWYGWQTLASDGTALTLLLTGAALDPESDPFFILGGGAYVLGGPIVHAAHGNWLRGGISLVLRAGAPFAGAGLGVALANCSAHSADFCGFGEAAIGGVVGIVAAITIDAAALAYDRVEDSPSASAVVPLVRVAKHHAVLGVAGVF